MLFDIVITVLYISKRKRRYYLLGLGSNFSVFSSFFIFFILLWSERGLSPEPPSSSCMICIGYAVCYALWYAECYALWYALWNAVWYAVWNAIWYVAGLWIRIHFMRIRIQQFFWMRIRIQVQLNQLWRKKIMKFS